MSNYILSHIANLTSIPKKPKVVCNNAVKNLTIKLKEAMNYDEFYKIDYEEYARKIIDDADINEVPEETKEQIRKRFLTKKPKKAEKEEDDNDEVQETNVGCKKTVSKAFLNKVEIFSSQSPPKDQVIHKPSPDITEQTTKNINIDQKIQQFNSSFNQSSNNQVIIKSQQKKKKKPSNIEKLEEEEEEEEDENDDKPVNDIVPVNNDQPVNDIVPVNNDQPVNDIVPVNNDQPVNDIVPVNNDQPVNDIVPVNNDQPVNDIVPVNNDQPVNDIVPVNNDQPVNDIVPVNNDQPVNDIVPVNNDQPVNDIVPVNNDQPVNDIVPVNNDQPVNDIVPVNNDQPVNDIVPVNNDQPVNDIVPVNNDQPVNDIVPVNNDQPVNDIVPVNNDQPVNDIVPVNNDQPVNDIVPVNNDQPVNDIVPVNNDQPVNDIVPVNNDQPVNDIVPVNNDQPVNDIVPVNNDQPVNDIVPVNNDQPVNDIVPVNNDQPVNDIVPVNNDQPVNDIVPVNNDQPVNDIVPVNNDQPVNDIVPVNNDQPVNDIVPVNNDQPVNDIVPVNNDQPVNDIVPVNNDQPVNDIVPVNNDQPVNDIVPVNNDQPVNDIVPVNNDQPVNDIVPVNNDQPVNDIVPVNNDQPVNDIVPVNNDQDDEEEDYDKQKNTYQIQILPDKKIICTACNKEIDDNPVYFSGLPYHIGCIKCMKCTEEQNSSQDLDKLVCVTPGCFFCPKHYEEYQSTKELDDNNQEEYHKKNKENFIKEMFEAPLYEEENIDYNPDDEIFITPDIVKSSIPKDRPFEDFIPTVTFTFEKSPLDIDFDALTKLLEEEGAVILSVDHGCTILKIAFLSIKKLSQKVVDKFHNLVSSLKNKFKSTIGKPVVGNLVEDPSITFPDDEKIMKNYNQKASVNLLQNISELSEIDLDTMKEEVLSTLHKEKVKKNWQFLFSHEDIFKMAEEHIRKDLYNNEFEMIMVAQTVIANKYIEDYEKVKNRINSGDLKIAILYHGSMLTNHTKIVKTHFLDPNKDKMKQLDAGYYGKGIYATENMFYASMYANGYSVLGCNQKAPIMCCLAIYNNNKIKEIKDMSWYGQKIEPEIANNYGVHHAFVGSSQSFKPVPESEKNTNWIWAEEYVFNNKFQIIPICSITLMRKEFYILWKDENIANSENSKYLNELSKQMEINVYTKNNVDDALKIIQQKRKNKIKLITNGGQGLTGRTLIEEARKIIGSDFVCLVFAGSSNHIDWVSKMKNVLFTTSPADFRTFAALDFNKKDVLGFINGLHYKDRFKIDENELLSFPSADRSKYK